jgi:NAD dependent epimerase/dehydratase family enzyme
MSQRCSAKKITNAGFNFQFNTIQQALNNIYGKA